MYRVTPFLALVLFTVYQWGPRIELDGASALLSVSTFTFSIFAGFFIARQGKRYSDIRKAVSEFDGEITGIYRNLGHINKIQQKKIREIIRAHYQVILQKKAWDYHFLHKSTTIQHIHEVLEKTMKGKKNLPGLQYAAIMHVTAALQRLQVIRKRMISLHRERIPQFIWVLLYLLSLVAILTVSVLPSSGLILESVIKSIFATTVLIVLIQLHKFDELRFFETTLGESSAQDILGIFDETR